MATLNDDGKSKQNPIKRILARVKKCFKRSPSPSHHTVSHQSESPNTPSILENSTRAGEPFNQNHGVGKFDKTFSQFCQSVTKETSTVDAFDSSRPTRTDELHEECRLGRFTIRIWNAAFEDVKDDEQMKELIYAYEEKLKKIIMQADVTENQTEESWGQGKIKECLQSIGETMKDAGRHEKAKSNTLAILTIVKGLDSFVSKMLSECPPAALAWAGICAAIPIVAAPMEQNQKMIKGLKHICDWAPTYFSLPDSLLQNDDPGSKVTGPKQSLQITIKMLYRHILEYVILSVCFINRRRFSRLWKVFSGQTDWESRLTDINHAETLISNSASIFQRFEHISITEEILKSIQEFENRAEAKERQKFIQRLKGTDYKERLDATSDRLEGTCEWFCRHEKFREWLHGSEGLLLVSADAGCGKSVLAKYLIEELLPEENPDATICYFFFKDDDKQARSFSNALKALLHRLLQLNETLANHCMMQSRNDLDHTSGFVQLWSAFAQTSTHAEAGPIICVLDALDESEPTERKNFMGSLGDFYTENGRTDQVKFLITTRGYPQIMNSFHALSSSKIHLDGNNEKEERQIQQEISIVMEDRLEKLINNRADIREDAHAQRVIQRGLGEKGTKQRTYLWMHLMFEILELTYPSMPGDWEKLFREPPSDIAKAYEKLLNSVKTDEKEDIRTLLALIIGSETPLTLRELKTAVTARETIREPRSFDIYDHLSSDALFMTWCRNQCGSFISFHGRHVHLIHQTAREFLQRGKTRPDQHQDDSFVWQGSLSEADCHRYVAESCISLLSLDKFRSSNFNKETQQKRHNSGKPETGKANPYYFLKYSAKHWLFHFRQCQLQTSSTDTNDIGTEFVPAYRSLFTNENRKPQKNHGEKRQAWYYFMMDAQPEGWCPHHYPMAYSVLRLFPNAYNVARTACLFGHLRLLKFSLEDLGADFDHEAYDSVKNFTSSDIDPRFSLAHFAAYAGSNSCLRYLSSRGCDMNIADGSNQTPLHQAAGRGMISTVETLIDLGASVAAVDDMQRTPFMCAIMNGVEGSDLNKLRKCLRRADDNGYDALNKVYGPEMRLLLRIAVRTAPGVPKRKPPYEPGEDLSWFKSDDFSKAYGKSPISALVKEGVDINQPIQKGMTALHVSVRRADLLYNTAFLLHGKANVHAVDKYGQTPLHVAVKAGNHAALGILKAYDADFNQRAENGDSALYLALRKENKKVYKSLCFFGANIEMEDSKVRELLTKKVYQKWM